MIIVAGIVRLNPGTLEELRPHMERMIAASRAESGCLDYAYAVDLLEPDLIRIYERWESRAALRAHGEADHLKAWRAVLKEVGIAGRHVTATEAGESWSL